MKQPFQAEGALCHCGKLRHSMYVERHNYIQKSIHLALCNKYGISAQHRVRGHKVPQVLTGKHGKIEIRVDKHQETDIHIEANRPDILVLDHQNKLIMIIEIGVTNATRLQQVEEEKKQKYETLLNELKAIYGYSGEVLSYVISWDGILTKRNKWVRERIGITDRTSAYIQTVTMSKTLEAINRTIGAQNEEDEYGVEKEYIGSR
eukprot:Filipodium_phascolosomae@DN2681_c0_g1_i3.p1